MLDINTIGKRYFSVKINGAELEVEPPKIKVLRKIVELSKNRSEDAIDQLSQAVSMILNKNKTGYKVPDDVIDELDMDQYLTILTEYFKWLTEVRSSPN